MAIESRIRLAYELGRLRLGAARALAVLPLAGLALALGSDWSTVLLAGVAAQIAVVALTSLGAEWGRSVAPGLLAGSLPLVFPLVTLMGGGHSCQECAPSDAVRFWCMTSCIVGGLTAGAILGWRATRLAAGRLRFALGAATLASLVGAMGCAQLGVMGTIAAMVGLVAGGTPVVVFRSHSAS